MNNTSIRSVAPSFTEGHGGWGRQDVFPDIYHSPKWPASYFRSLRETQGNAEGPTPRYFEVSNVLAGWLYQGRLYIYACGDGHKPADSEDPSTYQNSPTGIECLPRRLRKYTQLSWWKKTRRFGKRAIDQKRPR